MKIIRRPRLVNRTPYQRALPNFSSAQKQNSQLLSFYQEITKRLSILNQFQRKLEFDLEKNISKTPDINSQLIESINTVTTAFLYEVQQKSTQEAEKLRCLLRKSNGNKELNKIISEILSVFISFTHLQPSLGIALSTDDNHRFFDKHNLNNDIKPSPLPSLYRSADSSMDNLALCSTDSSSSTLIINPNDDENPTVLCRICEKLIPLDLIDKHSTLCIQGHQAKYQIIKSSDKLKKFNSKLSNQLSIPFPGDMKEATTVLYPLLYLYLTIDIAISFKGEEPVAISALDSALNGLNSIKLPKAALQYASLFEHGASLIQKKIKGLNEIEQKSREIAKTTVDHSVGNFYKEASLSDFEFLSRLSAGAFARVYLAKKKTTGDLYAIKVIKKTFANLKNQIRTVTVERDIMMQLHSPYMVNFYYSFIKTNNLYLVMEYLPGGDIYSLLQSVGSLPEESVRTYICQVVKALQFLRENKIIHRDLKPDNLLVDPSGFLRLTDFGLSLCGINGLQLSTRVGTPDYMAPEIVLPQNYSFSCDYWSLGVMTYEMLYGEPPFHGETEDETFKKILIGSFDLSDLEDVSETCKDFISKLLNPDPMKRLGAQRFEEIMEHPWFEGINWTKIREMEPVFVPDLHDETQNDYFMSRYEFPDDAENDIREDLKEQKEETNQNDEISKTNDDKNKKETNENVSSSDFSMIQKRASRKRSSTYNNIPSIKQNDLIDNNNSSNSVNNSVEEKIVSKKSAKTDESMNFEKVSLQHLKTMNEGESEKIRRKRSSTVTGIPPPISILYENQESENEINISDANQSARKTSSSLYENKNSILAKPVEKKPKMLQLSSTCHYLSSSSFNLPKYRPAQNQASQVAAPPSSLNGRPFKNTFPQKPHVRTATNHLRSGSTPHSHKVIQGNGHLLSPLVNSCNDDIDNENLDMIRHDIKPSNSFSNLNSILPSSKFYQRSDSFGNLNFNFSNVVEDDSIIVSSSSPSASKFECEYDEALPSSINKADIRKRTSHSNNFKNGQ